MHWYNFRPNNIFPSFSFQTVHGSEYDPISNSTSCCPSSNSTSCCPTSCCPCPTSCCTNDYFGGGWLRSRCVSCILIHSLFSLVLDFNLKNTQINYLWLCIVTPLKVYLLVLVLQFPFQVSVVFHHLSH